MKQIAVKGRLLLRKIFTALSFGAVATLWSCAYGVTVIDVEATVKAADTKEPIPGIRISIDGNYHGISDENGRFEYGADYDKKVTLLFEDIDGPENGEFHDKEITVSTDDDIHLTIFLDRK